MRFRRSHRRSYQPHFYTHFDALASAAAYSVMDCWDVVKFFMQLVEAPVAQLVLKLVAAFTFEIFTGKN